MAPPAHTPSPARHSTFLYSSRITHNWKWRTWCQQFLDIYNFSTFIIYSFLPCSYTKYLLFGFQRWTFRNLYASARAAVTKSHRRGWGGHTTATCFLTVLEAGGRR